MRKSNIKRDWFKQEMGMHIVYNVCFVCVDFLAMRIKKRIKEEKSGRKKK